MIPVPMKSMAGGLSRSLLLYGLRHRRSFTSTSSSISSIKPPNNNNDEAAAAAAAVAGKSSSSSSSSTFTPLDQLFDRHVRDGTLLFDKRQQRAAKKMTRLQMALCEYDHDAYLLQLKSLEEEHDEQRERERDDDERRRRSSSGNNNKDDEDDDKNR